jgi:hypothetical protein
MADRATLEALIGQLNSALGEVTPYKLGIAAPSELDPAPKNAHYMPKRVFDQLADNIKRDKNLSSLPFCWRRADGKYELLSGHHRVGAAKAAGVPLILFLYTDAALSKAEKIAVQLSHNSLVGQDNPTLLADLWRDIDDLSMKVYSGLDDEFIEKLAPPKLVKISDAPLHLEELTWLFFPPEIERINDVVTALKGYRAKTKLVAPLELFNQFFDTLLNFKEAAGIQNSATAMLAIIEIVEAWISEHKATKRDGNTGAEKQESAD